MCIEVNIGCGGLVGNEWSGGMEKMLFLVFHCSGSFLSKAPPGKRKTLQVQALEECAFYHGVALPSSSFDGR